MIWEMITLSVVGLIVFGGAITYIIGLLNSEED